MESESSPIGFIYNGEIVDLDRKGELPGDDSCLGLVDVFFDDSKEALYITRHTCLHLVARAIKLMYADAEFFCGDVLDDGFYYDFRTSCKVGEKDLPKIESCMLDFANSDVSITREIIAKPDALNMFSGDALRQLAISRVLGDSVGVCKQGDFRDLCSGPHLPCLKMLSNFKLTGVSGVYLDGSEDEQVLTRIHGTAFSCRSALEQHLERLEELSRRDHRRLGTDLKLFTFYEEMGPGLPVWLPRGTKVRQRLEGLLTRALLARGYEPVRGPEIIKKGVWEVSGHCQNYAGNMYFTAIDGIEYGIKPMNCVGHIKVYQSDVRSYRDLPIKLYEYGVVHRHERSGTLHGLLRVREFTQDDAHIFCTIDQIEEEIGEILSFVKSIMGSFGFSYDMELSTRPENFIGDENVWKLATSALEGALSRSGSLYDIDDGGGAFYGPKIDIKITDALGRKWQCGTIQVDMNLPERFNLEYRDSDNSNKRPVMIHRAILGSFERFVAILLEHYGGELPFFISPVQVLILPIKKEHLDYATYFHKMLLNEDIYSEISFKDESLSRRIKNAELQKPSIIVVIGSEECKNRTLSVRDRRKRGSTSAIDCYDIGIDEFVKDVSILNREVSF